MIKTRLAVFAAVLVALSMTAAACGGDDDDGGSGGGGGGSGGGGAETTKFTVALAAPMTAGYYPFFTATELGYFEEENLEIEFVSSDETPLQAFVENGTADLSTPGANEALFGAAEGASYKVIFDPWTLASEGVVVVDPAIQSMEDLRGKKVGLGTDEDSAAFAAALKEAGMSEDDVDTAVVGEGGPTVVTALQDGDIAAYASTGNVFAILESAGVELRDITPESLAATSSVALVASPDTIESQAAAVEGFLRAMAKGIWAGQANPEGMTEMYKVVVPDDWRDEKAAEATMQATFDFYKPVNDDMIGELIPERWENAMQRLLDAGELEEEVNIDELLDPQFIQAANDFDRAAVEKDLEDWLAENAG